MGCKSSTNTKNPTNKQQSQVPGPDPTDKSSAIKRQNSPQKSPRKMPNMPDGKQFEHINPSHLPVFIKQGKLDMVHGIIQHFNLGLSFLNIKGGEETFEGLKDKPSYSTFNPLLCAVADNQPDIVRYIIEDMKVSVKNLGRKPGDHGDDWKDPEKRAEIQYYCLKIACANLNIQTLEELWSYHQAWDLAQLNKLIEIISLIKWTAGLQLILKSYTTQAIFKSLSIDKQIEAVTKWFNYRSSQPPDFQSALTDGLNRGAFSLISMFVLLGSPDILTIQEMKDFISKGYQNITSEEYGHFKFSHKTRKGLLQDRMTAFENKSEQDKQSIQKLKDTIHSFEQLHEAHQYFKTEQTYQTYLDDLLNAFQRVDQEKIRSLIEIMDIRRLPLYSTTYSNFSNSTYLKNLENVKWSPVLHMVLHKGQPENKIIAVIQELILQGFRYKDFLKISFSQMEFQYKASGRPEWVRAIYGTIFIIAIEKGYDELLKYLWSDDFIHVWGAMHQELFFDTLSTNMNFKNIKYFINSNITQNIFMSNTEIKKSLFVRQTQIQFSQKPEALIQVREVLMASPYSVNLLLDFIDKDNFRKLTEFSVFLALVVNTKDEVLSDLAKNPKNENSFMNFMRYISMLKEEDHKRVNGQILIDRIFNLGAFQQYKGQEVSLRVLEYESRIHEEEGVEEAAGQIHINNIDASRKILTKDCNWLQFNQFIQDGREQDAINFLKNYKIQDLMFITGQSSSYESVYKILADESGKIQYAYAQVEKTSLNLLQLVIMKGFSKMVKYIFEEHKIVSSSKTAKAVDSRIIFLNQEEPNDETFTLRMALTIMDQTIFFYLWEQQWEKQSDENHFNSIYNEQHLYYLIKFLTFFKWFEAIELLLKSKTTKNIFLNSAYEVRQRIVSVLNEEAKEWQNFSKISSLINNEPYCRLDRGDDNDYQHIYRLIKDDEVDQLRETLEHGKFDGIAHMTFEKIGLENPVLQPVNDEVITISMLNPIMIAIESKSIQCLKYLVGKYGVRQAMGYSNITIEYQQGGKNDFSNLMIPLILKAKDVDMLQFLLNQKGFGFTQTDFYSFLTVAFYSNWVQGIKTLLWSSNAQFFFTTLSQEQQKNLISWIISFISGDQMTNANIKKNFVTSIIEETLTKRPYTKQMVLLLLEGSFAKTFDLTKLTRECLKNLISEDFMQIGFTQFNQIQKYEKQYEKTSLQGANFENEMAKIINRYVNEGKPDQKKEKGKVSFENEKNGSAIKNVPSNKI